MPVVRDPYSLIGKMRQEIDRLTRRVEALEADRQAHREGDKPADGMAAARAAKAAKKAAA
ncbi:MAG: hypothetical protein Q8R44_02515 [Novosphingobium sp.]|nr:hypothetical protein [Novosphingobium sp.]